MAKWPLFHTVLKDSPMMKTGELEEKLREQVCRSDVQTFLSYYESQGLITRPMKGLIVLVQEQKHGLLASLLVLIDGWKARRDERKRRERFERARIELELPLIGLELIAMQDENERPWISYVTKRVRKMLKDGKVDASVVEEVKRLKRKH